MLVPSASMSLVCFMPVAPVIPWTMTLLSLVRKIAMVLESLVPYFAAAASSAALSAAPSMVSTR